MANTVRVLVSAAVVEAAVKATFSGVETNVKAATNNSYVAGAWSVRAVVFAKDRIEIALYTSGKLVTQKTTDDQDKALYNAIEKAAASS